MFGQIFCKDCGVPRPFYDMWAFRAQQQEGNHAEIRGGIVAFFTMSFAQKLKH